MEINLNRIRRSLQGVADSYFPRLLTQACRDPDAPFHGCFDRNWWHYKIRDFPSAILQQGGYAAHWAGKTAAFGAHVEALDELAAASAKFWSQRAVKRGAFEEYYPWEQGYPPLAFSTLAVAKLCDEGVVEHGEILPGLTVAAEQLLARFEAQAANQQVAGLAALAAIRKAVPRLVPDAAFAEMARKTLALQDEEGWFHEYGGPDLGYLSVTMDCLMDLFDLTGEVRFLGSAAKAFVCIEWFTRAGFRGAGMHNARNTDYLVPYGICRFVSLGDGWKTRALAMLETLYSDCSDPAHFFQAVDDRYVSHYIGHSLFRAIVLLESLNMEDLSAEARPQGPGTSGARLCGGTDGVQEISPIEEDQLVHSGHYRLGTGEGFLMLVSYNKGGIFTARNGRGATVADFGWLVREAPKTHVTHWWSDQWTMRREEGALIVEGPLVSHVERQSSPFKHFVLRVLAFLFGRKIIGMLKSLYIFKRPETAFRMERRISLEQGKIRVRDRLSGPTGRGRVERAPRASKRHVSSADSFHIEDLQKVWAVRVEFSKSERAESLSLETLYTAEE